VILNSLHFSYPLPILMRVSYNTLIVKQNTSDYYKYKNKVAIWLNSLSFYVLIFINGLMADRLQVNFGEENS